MKAFLISDNIDTWVGMRLSGIEGVVVSQKEDILSEISRASSDKETGIIVVTEGIASLARENIDRLKLEMGIPLIVEIPDRHGSIMEKDRITRYIRESIGVKI